ncbi:hypothetical protein [Streptomyces zagrosensis]|uniref:CHAT domain-containing protein n=1 Tax=Streptomyces zagrosensis TaxID=1042984 RepID=A0A7W9UYA0_9ACTN|nr:hypothetical protein [Streptomyces zagrosensis]MBB5935733.1 hypothetical protein [Streptomyces zagrosensis]
MDENISLTANQNASAGYRLLPHAPASEPRDLTVCIRIPGKDVQPMINLWSESLVLPRSRTREHWAHLEANVSNIKDLTAQLLADWKAFVDFQPTDQATRRPIGVRPYATAADLSTRPPLEVEARVAELARSGQHLLKELLKGSNPNLARFRAYLISALERRDLRIRFDSDLELPWPMLAVGDGAPPIPGQPPTADPFDLFLGHRHLIESASGEYETDYYYVAARSRPVSSANVDHTLHNVARAPEVIKLLDDQTELIERTHSDVLLADLAMAHFDEDLMYFFCHGAVITDGDSIWQALRLTDPRTLHAGRIGSTRELHTEANRKQGAVVPFHPLVLFNVCYAGAPVTGRFARLAACLIQHGAQGVLAPHIAVPKVLGVEFALRFLTLYLVERMAAGAAVRDTVRWFAAEYRNPLALVYGLHCGLDSRLAPSGPQEGADA